MRKTTIPIDLVDETGVKNNKEPYCCEKCNKKIEFDKILKEGWYYKIKKKEAELIRLKNKMGYVSIDDVTFLCKEDYHKLATDKVKDFVEVGLPYYISIIDKIGGIFSF